MKRVLLVVVMMMVLGAVSAQDHIEFRQYGIYSVIDYASSFNLNNDPEGVKNLSFSELTGVVGYQIRQQTAVGLGVTYLSEPTNAYTQLPIFVELRSHYTRHRLSPFTVMQLGYNLPIGHSSGGDEAVTITKGGMMFGLTVGARFALSRNLGFNIFAGYRMLLMNEVEFMHDGLLAQRMPVQFHLVRVGGGINF